MKLFFLFLSLWLCQAVYGQRKNVLVLLGDGAGRVMGAYNHSDVSTPHLDQLAARSVLFTRAYSSDSASSPARAALLSGLPPHQTGMFGRSDGVARFSSPSSLPTLPAILSAHNVRTGIIGRKHVKPSSVYQFDFEATEEQYDLNAIGRNITLIKDLVGQFVANDTNRPFFLVVSFHDPWRCGAGAAQYGEFCERWGSGQPGMGSIPDWKPRSYNPQALTVPYFLPDNPSTRQDLAAMYTALDRMDQGVGVVMTELQRAGVADSTLVVYTSVSGVPFPLAHNDLYEPGMAMPLLLSSPLHPNRWAQRTEAVASSVDILPTVLDWFGLPPAPSPAPKLTGQSLLPLTAHPSAVSAFSRAFSSHNLDEMTMYYPMRVIRTPQYRLIHNLNYRAAFPVSGDIATSPTFFSIVNSTTHNLPTGWLRSLVRYYFRDQWELFDTDYDRFEMENDVSDPAHLAVLKSLRQELEAWQETTQDPWRCLPSGVLLANGSCLAAGNMEP